MLSRRLLGSFFGALLAAAAAGAEHNSVTLTVDGVDIAGVVGYRVDFNRQGVSAVDSRRLGLAYSPDQRKLSLTVTQRGLNRLQDWINSATSGEAPVPRTVQITVKDEKDEVLVRWEISGVLPTTLSSAAAGLVGEVTATLEFVFDKLRLLEANGK
ncbi:MAG: hypothetical protein ACM3SU_08070 [Acidobacteriota bacterium]